jgi:hypothetical protein
MKKRERIELKCGSNAREKRWQQILDQIGHEQGVASEQYFVEVLQMGKGENRLPPWLVGWEHLARGSALERAGIDVIVKTTRGDININIKSSQRNADAKRSKLNSRGIEVYAVYILEDKNVALGKIISFLGRIYRSRQSGAAA